MPRHKNQDSDSGLLPPTSLDMLLPHWMVLWPQNLAVLGLGEGPDMEKPSFLNYPLRALSLLATFTKVSIVYFSGCVANVFLL